MRKKALGRWREYTWAEYAERTARVGLGLLELGVEPGDCVAVHGENRPAWLLADLGVQGIGARTVGVYPTSPAAEVEHVLGHSGAVVAVVEDQEQLDKALAVRHRLPCLRAIVVVDPSGLRRFSDPMVTTFAELEALGRRRPVGEFEERVGAVAPSQVAIVVYTSGTTGPPKGAMLTHANLLAGVGGLAGGARVDLGPDDDVLSYLPLCHVAERTVSVVNALALGYVVNFPERPETVLTDLAEVQPTFFLGVPRTWERFLAAVETRARDASTLKRASYRFWLARGRTVAARRTAGARAGPVYLLGWLLLYRGIRRELGLGRVRHAICGAAPVAPGVLERFWALGVPVREAYGLTEAGLATVNRPGRVRIGTVGTAAPGVELRIAKDGEILLRGPAVFVGYLGDPEASAAAVDGQGWLHTGDVGTVDADGCLTVTDRKKDIMITAGGKNISPTEIESKLKASPYIREAVVVGDGRPYLTALIGIELATVGDWASRQGIAFTTYADLASKPAVRALVEDWVEQVNGGLARAEAVKRFELLPRELDQDEDEVTATQKVKRKAVAERYAGLIEGLYRPQEPTLASR